METKTTGFLHLSAVANDVVWHCFMFTIKPTKRFVNIVLPAAVL